MIDQPPEALVRGCNDPISIGVLSDWIEEQYGIALDYEQSGWSEDDIFDNINLFNIGSGFNYLNGNGTYYGTINGCGYGNGILYNYGSINRNGNGTGYGDGTGYECDE